mmetsp:Transcript_12246/g.47283  ORF Transcript_12246/g.47283 Transcript_12246/m.47283 type:complete len:277 (+) Transcript_12246:815-1645(+)
MCGTRWWGRRRGQERQLARRSSRRCASTFQPGRAGGPCRRRGSEGGPRSPQCCGTAGRPRGCCATWLPWPRCWRRRRFASGMLCGWTRTAGAAPRRQLSGWGFPRSRRSFCWQRRGGESESRCRATWCRTTPTCLQPTSAACRGPRRTRTRTRWAACRCWTRASSWCRHGLSCSNWNRGSGSSPLRWFGRLPSRFTSLTPCRASKWKGPSLTTGCSIRTSRCPCCARCSLGLRVALGRSRLRWLWPGAGGRPDVPAARPRGVARRRSDCGQITSLL